MDIARIRKKIKEAEKKKEIAALPPSEEFAETQSAEVTQIDFLRFILKGKSYAIRIFKVQEILKPQKITVVPRVNAFMLGIATFRGKVIPIADIGKRLSGGDNSGMHAMSSKILILAGSKGPIGVPIDGAMDVISLLEDDILAPPSHLDENELRFIEGVAMPDGNFVSVINIDELLDFNVTLEA